MVEETEEPVVEATEEPVVEATEEPVVEETEEPVVEETADGENAAYEAACTEHSWEKQYNYYSYIPGTVVDDGNGRTHTGLYDYYESSKCTVCGEWKYEVIFESVERTEEHSFEDGVCYQCGYENTCEHANTYTSAWMTPVDGAELTSDEETHTGTFIRHVNTWCRDCGEKVDYAEEDAIGTYPHDWNDEGFCDVCGYENSCEHANVRNTGHRYEVKPGTEVTYDINGHTGTFIYTDISECMDCGARLYTDSEVSGTFDHDFVDMVCYICGYEIKCTHNPEPRETKVFYTDEAVDNDDGTHTVPIGKAMSAYCNICQVEISHETISEPTPVTEAHRFNSEDNDYCWVCGAKNTCEHPEDKVEHLDQVYHNMVWGEITDTTHTFTCDLYSQDHCTGCDTWFNEKLIEENATITENHYYYDGYCWCGKAGTNCAHKTKVNGETYPLITEETVYTPIAGSLNGVRHTFVADEVHDKLCKECGLAVEWAILDNAAQTFLGDCVDENADSLCDLCGAEMGGDEGTEGVEAWAKAPYIDPNSVSQPAEKQVKFGWIGEAAKYNVYEEKGETDEVVATVTTGSVTLKSVALGAHTYYVVPVGADAEGNEIEGQPSNSVTWRVDSLAWKKAPTMKTAKQMTDAEGVVELTWTHAAPAESYVIYDGEDAVAVSTELSVTLEGVKAGKHSYSVLPQQHDYRGELLKGAKSKAKALTVADLWNKKPTLSAAKQDTTGAGEGLVLLTFKPGKGALTKAYAIFDKFDGETNIVALVESEEATVTYTLQDVPVGSHVFSVAPVDTNDDGSIAFELNEAGEYVPVTGTASATKTAKVAALWNKKGTISVAKQLDTEEGLVQLTWKSGSELTQAWQIFDKFGGATNPVGDPVVSSEATVTAYVSDLAPGSHVFSVKPVEVDENGVVLDENGEPVVGAVSKTKTVKVAEFWVKAPTITAVEQTGAALSDEVAATVKITWTAGSEHTEAFAVYDTFNKAKSLKTVVVGETTAEVELADTGSHSFTVVPVKLDENGEYDIDNLELGKASKAKALKVTAATWADAPVLKAVQKVDEAEGEVLLSWTQIVEADGFEVYEVISKKNVPVDGDESEPTVQAGAMEHVLRGVKDGKHTYVVKPMRYDENEGWTTLTEGGVSAKNSNSAAVTVKEQWSLKPVIDEAVQELEADNVVTLEWTPGSPLTEAFEVFDGGKQILDEDGNPLIVTEPYAELYDVKTGSHKYTIKPIKYNEDGVTYEYGTASAAKTVKVTALWNTKPTIKSAVQLTDGEGRVKLTFTTKAKVVEEFEIRNKFAGETNPVEDYEMTVEDGLYTVVIDGLEKGSNVFSVVPMHYDDETGEYEYGTASSTKSVSVKYLWNLKPTGLTATQIKSYNDLKEEEYPFVWLDEGLVRLTWNAGSNPNMSESFAVFANGVEVTDIVYDNFIPVGESGINSVIIAGQKAASNKYTVKPVNGEGEYGVASAAKTLKVVELWKTAPTLKSVRQSSANEVEIVWTAGSEVQDLFVVYDTVGKTTTEVWRTEALAKGDDVYDYYATVENVENGTHKYTVKAYVYGEDGEPVEGATSSAVSVTVVDSNWSTAPWITYVYQESIDSVTIGWDHVSRAESYIVYELVGTEFKQVGELETKNLSEDDLEYLSLTVPFEKTGKHTYAVRPQMTDPDNDGAMLLGSMSKTVTEELYAIDSKITGFTVNHTGFVASLEWDMHRMADSYIAEMIDSEGNVTEQQVGYYPCECEFNVPAAGEYTFRVRPVFYDKNSAEVMGEYSNEIKVEFGESVVLNAEFKPEKEGVVLTWTQSTASSVSGYRIYRQGPDDEEMEILASGSFANRTYTDTAVQMGESYTYAVGAFRTSGEDVLSAPVTVDVAMAIPDRVENLEGFYNFDEIVLTWDEVENLPESYEVFYEIYSVELIGEGEDTTANRTKIGTTTRLTYIIEDADPSKTHIYSVRACANVGDYTVSGQHSLSYAVEPPVAASLTSLEFDVNQGGVVVEWNAVEGAFYQIYRTDLADPVFATGESDVTSYLDTTVALGNTYTYYIVTTVESNTTKSASMSIQLKQLGRVTNLTARFDNQNVELAWDDMVTVSGYEIQRSDDDGATYTTIQTVTGTTYTDEVPSLGAKYIYRVRALIGDKAGAWSAVAAVEIGERPVMKSAAYSHKAGGVVIEWEAYEGANGYAIYRKAEGDTGHNFYAEVKADQTTYTDPGVELGKTYSYKVAVAVNGGVLVSENTFEVTPEPLPTVGAARTFYFNETTEIYLTLPENASEEFTYVVKENGELIESTVEEDEGEWKLVFDAEDLGDHTYTIHVGVVMADGSVATGEGTSVTIDRGELWKLKDITDDEDGVHLYWDVHEDSMPKMLFVMSYDVTDKDHHINRGGMNADPVSGEYLDAEVALSGKKLDYWLEAIYENGVLSSEGISGIEGMLPYTVNTTLFSYYERTDGTISVYGYRGKNLENLVIPSVIDGYTVSMIGDYGDHFQTNHGKLTGTITLPDTLKKLGGLAFEDQELTGKLILPKGLDEVADMGNVFAGNTFTEVEIYCKNLTEEEVELLGLPETVVTMYGYYGSGAHDYATAKGIEFAGIGLTDDGVSFDMAEDGTAIFMGMEDATGAVTIPATVNGIAVTKIGDRAFKGNTAITSVTVPAGVTEIGESAFEGCTSLTSATLPDSVEIIGVRAFANCTSLSSMTAE